MEGEDSELTEQDRRTLKTLARTIRDSEVDRRDLLKMGLGGAMGAGATHLLTGGAMASASTTDSDGDIGTPSNRVDVFSDGVDANSVATDGIEFTGAGFGQAETTTATFGTWTNISSETSATSDKPALLQIEVEAQTDGTTNAVIRLELDRSGGTTADIRWLLARADADAGSGTYVMRMSTAYIPQGAQFRVVNSADPNAVNSIREQEALVQ